MTVKELMKTAVTTCAPLARISIDEVMSRPVFTCFADENVKTVLADRAVEVVNS